MNASPECLKNDPDRSADALRAVNRFSSIAACPSIVNRQSGRPLVAATLAFMLGVASAKICENYCFTGVAAGTLLLITSAALSLRRNRLILAWSLAVAAIVFCGALLGWANRDAFAQNDVRALLAERRFPLDESLYFDGCAVEESARQGNDSVVTIEFHGIRLKDQWIAARGKGLLRVRMPNDDDSARPLLMRGDKVIGWAVWRMPRNYENPGADDRVSRLARRGIFVQGRTKSVQLLEIFPEDCAGITDKFANLVRNRVRAGLEPVKNEKNGQPAAILASLVIGDYTGLSTATREAFQNTGTFHVLIVSGLHVAWLAGALLYILKHLFLPDRFCWFLTALAVSAYACVVGMQTSVARCLCVFILLLIGRIFFRRADALNILFAAAFILLAINPDWLFETGFQLSFLSVAAILLTAVPFVDSYIKPLLEPLRHCGDAKRIFTQSGVWHRRGRRLRTQCELLAEGLADRFHPKIFSGVSWIFRKTGSAAMAAGSIMAVSVSVQLWIEPLLSHYFNRLSWIGVLANISIVPLSSLTLAAGIAGILPFGGAAIAKIAGGCASLMLYSAEMIARIPGAWQRCPTPSGAWVFVGIALLMAWGLFRLRRFWIPGLYVGLLLTCLVFGIVPLPESFRIFGNGDIYWPKDAAVLRLTFLDVRQGDAIVIRFPDGRVWTLDAGGIAFSYQEEDDGNDYVFDVGEAVVSRYLWHQWIGRLDRVLISHADADHAGGVPAIMRNFKVAGFDYAPAGANQPALEKLLKLAQARKIPEHEVFAGMEKHAGAVGVRAIHPALNSELKGGNEGSLVLRLTYKRFSALLTGDLEKSGETSLLRSGENLQSSLLKVAHHGSRYSTSNEWLDSVKPRWAVISVGRNNPYRHPSPETLARLDRHSARVFSTMNHGAVILETDGIRYVIHSHIQGIMEEGILPDDD